MPSASTPGLAVAEFSDDGPKLVRWHRKTRSRDDRSRPGVVSEISLARRSFAPLFPAGPTA